MVGTAGKCHIHIRFQILKGLSRQGENEVHRYRLKGNFSQGRGHGSGIHGLPAQSCLVFAQERLDADADFGNSGIFQLMKSRNRHIVRMQFQTDSLGYLKEFPAGFDDFPQPISRQSRGTTTEIEAGDPFPLLILDAHHSDLLQEGINVTVTEHFVVAHFAVGAEITDALTEGNMDVQT